MSARKVHVALKVSDLSKSTEFYRALFGLEPAKVQPGYAKFDVDEPPLNLALNETPADEIRPGGGLSHLGIQVASTDEVRAMQQRLHGAGLATREEMQTQCCYALQDKVWLRDPDGNEWEVFVVIGDSTDRQLSKSRAPRTSRIEPDLKDESATAVSCCADRRDDPTPHSEAALPEHAGDAAEGNDGAACCSTGQRTARKKVPRDEYADA